MDDPNQLLARALSRKRLSRTARDEGRLPDAARHLKDAVDMLEEARRADRAAGDFVSRDMQDIARELADCYGSLGGIRRRDRDFPGALESYEKGAEIERSPRYGVDNTYNQVQSVVLAVLNDEAQIEASDWQQRVSLALDAVERQIETTRGDDPWAYSDAGLLHCLLGDGPNARRYWRLVDHQAPTPAVYQSGLKVLEDLLEKLPGNLLIKEAVERFQRQG